MWREWRCVDIISPGTNEPFHGYYHFKGMVYGKQNNFNLVTNQPSELTACHLLRGFTIRNQEIDTHTRIVASTCDWDISGEWTANDEFYGVRTCHHRLSEIRRQFCTECHVLYTPFFKYSPNKFRFGCVWIYDYLVTQSVIICPEISKYLRMVLDFKVKDLPHGNNFRSNLLSHTEMYINKLLVTADKIWRTYLLVCFWPIRCTHGSDRRIHSAIAYYRWRNKRLCEGVHGIQEFYWRNAIGSRSAEFYYFIWTKLLCGHYRYDKLKNNITDTR